MHEQLPVAVIGAGPVGPRGRGAPSARAAWSRWCSRPATAVGASVREWGHVRVFSPWEYDIDPTAAELLERHGWDAPAGDEYPTGAEIVERYLEPLAALPEIAAATAPQRARGRRHPRAASTSSRTPGATRRRSSCASSATASRSALSRARRHRRVGHMDATEPARRRRPARRGRARARRPHRLRDPGRPRRRPRALRGPARAGGRQRPLGPQRPPRPRRAARARAGDARSCGPFAAASPATASAAAAPTSSPPAARSGGPCAAAGRRRGRAGHGLSDRGRGRRRRAAGRRSTASASLVVDEVVAATGFRPDLALLGELRLDLDDRVEAPRALAPLIDPNVHSCGSVPPHGVDELSHPDAGFYVVGMKSYGRAPDLPAAHRLRAGALGRGGAGRRLGGGARRSSSCFPRPASAALPRAGERRPAERRAACAAPRAAAPARERELVSDAA